MFKNKKKISQTQFGAQLFSPDQYNTIKGNVIFKVLVIVFIEDFSMLILSFDFKRVYKLYTMNNKEVVGATLEKIWQDKGCIE